MQRSAAPATATHQVVSADGSRIGFASVGTGPHLLLLHGAAADRSQWAPVAAPLSDRFTVHLVDRRGRGLSMEEMQGDYGLEREAEDVAAVVDALGEPPHVFAHSYGGLCALKAAVEGVRFARMCIDESPTGRPGPPMVPEPAVDRLRAALVDGGPEATLELFLRMVVGLNDEQIAGQRGTPVWTERTKTIHTLVREADAANRYQRETAALARLGAPLWFVVGDESPEPMRIAAETAHADLPRSGLVHVGGRLFTSMYADPPQVAGVLSDWFLGDAPIEPSGA